MSKIKSIKKILSTSFAIILCYLLLNLFKNTPITSFCETIYESTSVETKISKIGNIDIDLPDRLLLIWEGGKQGYIDINGKVIIKPFLNKNFIIGSNSRYLIANQIGQKWNLIDASGKSILDDKFDSAHPLSHTLMGIKKNGKYKVIDYMGKSLTDFDYDSVSKYKENLAPVKKFNKWSFLTTSGRLIAPFIFDDVNSFAGGRAGVKQGKYWNFIDPDGKFISDSQYLFVGDFAEGVAAVRDKNTDGSNRSIDFINDRGNVLFKSPTNIKISDGYLGEFQGGRFTFETYSDLDMLIDVFFHNGGTSSGLRNKTINRNGELLESKLPIISCSECICSFRDLNKTVTYREDLPFSDLSMKGFMNADQKVIVQPQLEDVGDFVEGLAFVRKNGKYGFIDRSSTFIIQPQFDLASSFYHGIAIIRSKQSNSKNYVFKGYINKRGEFIWKVL